MPVFPSTLMPLVSIGVPVHNGDKTLAPVLKSLLSQSHANIEIVISENYSSDSTQEVCKYFAQEDSRIRLYIQDKLLSPADNFTFVLKQAKGDFFMWAAADDLRDSRFVESCIKLLTSYQDCIAATSLDRIACSSINEYEIVGDKSCRISSFLDNPFTSYGLFYSITRTDVAKAFRMSSESKLAEDWKYICYLASLGNIKRARNSLTIFDDGGLSNSDSRFSAFRSSFIDWLLPLGSFTAYTLTLIKSENKIKRRHIRHKLIQLNYSTAISQIQFETKQCKSSFSRFAFFLALFMLRRLRPFYFAFFCLPKYKI